MPEDPFFKCDFVNPSKSRKIPAFVPWVLAGILAIAVAVLSFLLATQKPTGDAPAWQMVELNRDVMYSDIANHAASFVNSLMHFSESGFQEHLQNINDLCLPEYSNKLYLVVSNPAVADLIKQKRVKASSEIEEPRILGVGKDGKIQVNVTGKLTLESPLTNFSSVSRYFKSPW